MLRDLISYNYVRCLIPGDYFWNHASEFNQYCSYFHCFSKILLHCSEVDAYPQIDLKTKTNKRDHCYLVYVSKHMECQIKISIKILNTCIM